MLVALKRKLLKIMDNNKRRAVRMFYVSTVDFKKGNRGRMRKCTEGIWSFVASPLYKRQLGHW